TVVDLKTFFGLPDEGLTDLHRVLRVGNDEMEFGVLADLELGLLHVEPHSLQPPLPTLTGIGAEYVRGITPDRLIVLDMAAILRDPRLQVDEQA
ncbi:MAG: chemotaxis protein CheW, partial [Lysobacteraceae bacterium]